MLNEKVSKQVLKKTKTLLYAIFLYSVAVEYKHVINKMQDSLFETCLLFIFPLQYTT